MKETRIEKDGGTIDLTQHFDSVMEFMDLAEHGESHLEDFKRSSLSDQGHSFNTFRTMPEALEAARYGWEHGREMMNRFEIKAENARIDGVEVLDMKRDVTGSVIDMGAFMSGDPECMFEMAYHETEKPVVNIEVLLSMGSYVDEQTVMRRGCAVMALVDSLESCGVRVGITGYTSSTGAGSDSKAFHECVIEIKRPQDPLEKDQVMFALAAADFFRRFGFSIREQGGKKFCKQMGVGDGNGYGRTVNPRHWQDPVKNTADIKLGGTYTDPEKNEFSYGSFETDEQCQAWINEQASRFVVIRQ